MVKRFVNVSQNFSTLNFSYDIQSYLLMAKATIVKENIFKTWGGYLNGAIGAACNRLSNYKETYPTGSTARPMLSMYKSNNQAALAFSAGLGISKALEHGRKLTIGYKYINSGSAKLGTTTIQQTTQQLSSAKLGHHLFNVSLVA